MGRLRRCELTMPMIADRIANNVRINQLFVKILITRNPSTKSI